MAGTHPLHWIGRAALGLVREVGMTSRVAGYGVLALFRGPVRLRLILEQMAFIGVQSLPIVLLSGVFTGAVITFESAMAASYFGAEGMVSGSVGVALTRELAPTLTGLLVAGRAGSAIAAELGTMRISEQIDAMVTMAVDPFNYLVKPRIVAAVLVLPMLTLMFDAVGIMGSWAVSMYSLHMTEPEFFVRLRDWVDWVDVYAGLVKALVFGFVIAVVGCTKGLYAGGGAAGVGRATTAAVVVSSVIILVANYFIATVTPQ